MGQSPAHRLVASYKKCLRMYPRFYINWWQSLQFPYVDRQLIQIAHCFALEFSKLLYQRAREIVCSPRAFLLWECLRLQKERACENKNFPLPRMMNKFIYIKRRGSSEVGS